MSKGAAWSTMSPSQGPPATTGHGIPHSWPQTVKKINVRLHHGHTGFGHGGSGKLLKVHGQGKSAEQSCQRPPPPRPRNRPTREVGTCPACVRVYL